MSNFAQEAFLGEKTGKTLTVIYYSLVLLACDFQLNLNCLTRLFAWAYLLHLGNGFVRLLVTK